MNGGSQRFTLDTNILVYVVDRAAGPRRDLAGEIVEHAVHLDCWLTLQSISEFYSVVTRKGMMPRSDAAAQAEDWLRLFRCGSHSIATLRTALALSASGRASFWDALLVATAAEAGCHVILTEDLDNGASLAGMRIHNPFDPAGGLTAEARQLLGMA